MRARTHATVFRYLLALLASLLLSGAVMLGVYVQLPMPWLAIAIAGTALALFSAYGFIVRSRLTRAVTPVTTALQALADNGATDIGKVRTTANDLGLGRSFNNMLARAQAVEEELQSTLRQHQEDVNAAQQREALHSAMLDASLDGFITVDASGLVVEFNQIATDIFG